MRRPEWLTRETEPWEAEGVITPEQRQTILDRYPASHDEQLTSRTLAPAIGVCARHSRVGVGLVGGPVVVGVDLDGVAEYCAGDAHDKRGA